MQEKGEVARIGNFELTGAYTYNNIYLKYYNNKKRLLYTGV